MTLNEKALEAAANRIALRMEMGSTPRSIAEDAITSGELVERLRAWGPLVSSGYECPAAGTAMHDAATTLTAADATIADLRAKNEAQEAEIERMRKIAVDLLHHPSSLEAQAAARTLQEANNG